jgi:hypothetical protein
MEFEMATSYKKPNAFSKKRKEMALKAIEANINDPAIEKAILLKIMSSHADNEKENKPIASLLSLSRGGKSKTALYERKKTNSSIIKGLGVLLGRRSKIAPETYTKELLVFGFSKLHQVQQPNASKQVSQAVSSLASSASSLERPLLSNQLTLNHEMNRSRPRIEGVSSSSEQETSQVRSELRTSLEDLLSDDDDVPVKKSKRRRLTEPLRQEIGPALLEHVVEDLKRPSDKRPILARFKSYPRRTIEKVTGLKISNREYSNIQKHALGAGAWQPVEKVKSSKNRMSPRVLVALFRLLSDPNSLQRHAFGQKFVETFGGRDFVTMDRIETNEKASKLAAKLVVSLLDESEVLTNGDLPESHLRCQTLERDSFRRCLCDRVHIGKKCRFTPKDGCSMTKATQFIKMLTGGELKQLTGLDDIKVERGRDNFIRIRKLIEQLVCEANQRINLTKEIDEAELFHKTDFSNHLERAGEFACSCLTCGFYNNGKYHSTFVLFVLYYYANTMLLTPSQNQNDLRKLFAQADINTKDPASIASGATLSSPSYTR